MIKIKTVVIILKILADFIVHRNFGKYYTPLNNTAEYT